MTFFIRISILLRFIVVLIKSYFFKETKNNNLNNKKNKKSIPVVIFDLKKEKFFKYSSINEAAKFLNTYPNTIWRKIQTKELYLNRYSITVMSRYYYLKVCYIYLRKCIINYQILILKITLFLILLIIIYIITIDLLIILKDIINKFNIHTINTRSNQLGYMLEHKIKIETNQIRLISIEEKISKFLNTDKSWEDRYNLLYNNIFNKSSIINSILIGLINLDFHSVAPSPIIDNITNQQLINNSLDAQGLRLNTNLPEIILQNRMIESRPKELLNYQSNILYLLINGISPSLY